MKTRTFLFEVSPRLNGIPQTLHLAGLNSVRGADTQLNGYQWLPCISARPTFSTSFAQNGLLTTVTQNWGQLTFYCSDSFGNMDWSSLEWNGALGRVWVGHEGDDFSSYTQIFEGSTGNLTRSGSKATLTLKGSESILDTNLLTESYGGTGGLDGDTGMMGRLKPRAFGYCQTVTPVEINAANLVYQVHAYGPVLSIPAVYEFAWSKGAAKADYPDYASLVAAPLGLAEWATCLAHGLFRLGGQPSKLLTADVQPTGSQTVATIVPELLVAAGVPAPRIGDMTAFASSQWSLYQTEQASVGDVVRQAVYEAGGYLFADGTGSWQVGDYYAAQAPVVVNEDRSSLPLARSIDELDANGPVWKASVGHDRCWTVHNQDDVSPAISVLSDAQLAQDAAIQKAQEDADRANSDNVVQAARIAAQDSDGVISRGEKADRLLQLAQITTEYAGLSTQGSAFNIAAQQANYVTAYQNLVGYVAGLVPPLTDSAHDTPIDPAVDQQRYHDLYQARYDLRVALTGKAAQTADYTLIRDDAGTKPQDNATNGAPSGTQVAGVDAGTLVSTANTAAATAAAAKASYDALNTVTIPALRAADDQAQSDIAAARSKAAGDLADAKTTLSAATASVAADVLTVRSQADAARSDAATIATNLAGEVSRAQGAEGTISTSLVNLGLTVGQNVSAISGEVTQRVTADGALSSRIDAVSSGTAANAAAISTTNTTLTNAVAAQAARTTAIESTYGSQGGSLDANPNFAVWPDGQALPTGWSWWANAHQAQRIANTSPTGGWIARVVSDASEGGLAQWDGLGTQIATAVGWYVLDVDVALVSGSWVGAGVTLHGQAGINFASDPDGAGDVSVTKPGRRLFSKLVFNSGANAHNWHDMDNWGGFGTPVAKTLDWYRSSIRPASDAEVQAGKATSAVAANTARIATEEVTRSSADGALSSRIDNISASSGDAGAAIQNEASARANADGALGARVDRVTADYQNADSQTMSAITNEAAARSDADGALSSRTSGLESRFSGYGGNVANDFGYVVGRIGTEETTRSNADGALSVRLDQVTSAYQAADTATNATISTNYTALSNRTQALADRATSLESSVNTVGGSLTLNDRFANWTDPAGYPTAWQVWQNNGSFRIARQPGIASPWALQQLNDTQGANSGLYQPTINMTLGWYVIEVTARLDANVLDGAGVTLHGQYNIDFITDADINGFTGGVAQGTTRTWSKLVNNTTLNGAGYNLHAMQGWDGFGHAIAPKYVTWFHLAVRPASDAEIKAQRAYSTDIPNTVARIASEESTRSGADAALSSRTSTLESQFALTTDSPAFARIRSEESARASADGGLSQRIDQVQSGYQNADNALSGTITNNYTALSNATSAVTQRTTNLESYANSNTGNLNNLTSRVSTAENAITTNQQASASRTSILEASLGVSLNVNGYLSNSSGGAIPYGWGQWARDNNSNIYSDPPQSVRPGNYPTTTYRDGRSNVGFAQGIGNVPGGWYVVEADVRKLGSGNWQGAGVLIGHNGTSDNINFAASPSVDGVVYGGNNSNDRRAFSKMIFMNGQTDMQIYAMGGWDGFGLDGSSDHFVWFQCSIRKASDAEIKAQKVSDANLVARVTTSEGAITGLNGRTAAYWQTTAVAGNNRAQLSIHADANQGGGVDIVGDVSISGNLITTGTINARAIQINGVDVSNMDSSSMAREGTASWSGSLTGNQQVPFSLTLNPISPKGRFLFNDSSYAMTTNANQTTTSTYNGRPLYTNYQNDGGLFIRSYDDQGHTYQFNGVLGSSLPVLATTTFGTTFVANIVNGNYDSGIVNEGDYYQRTVSATYTVTNINLHVTWLAI